MALNANEYKPKKTAKLISSTLLLGLLISASIPHITTTPLSNGGAIKIHSSSFLGSFFESKSLIEIETVSNQTFKVELLNQPLIVIPSTNTDMFFCACAQDPYYVLIRINTAQPFSKISPKSPIADSVVSSNCRIERVLLNQVEDWNFVASQVQTMSSHQYRKQSVPALRLFGLSLPYYNQQSLAATMRNRGDAGQFEDDFP